MVEKIQFLDHSHLVTLKIQTIHQQHHNMCPLETMFRAPRGYVYMSWQERAKFDSLLNLQGLEDCKQFLFHGLSC